MVKEFRGFSVEYCTNSINKFAKENGLKVSQITEPTKYESEYSVVALFEEQCTYNYKSYLEAKRNERREQYFSVMRGTIPDWMLYAEAERLFGK